MTETRATIKNEAGIHCRPSAMIFKELGSYPGSIELTTDAGATSVTSVMDLLSMSLSQNTQVRVRVEGPDEEKICKRMAELLETNFDFPNAGSGLGAM